MFCVSCGVENTDSASFCQSCGKKIPRLGELKNDSKTSLFSKISALSVKGKFFYGAWVFINIIFVSEYISGSLKPIDRFQSLCTTENLNCAPTGQEMMDHALGNLILWNIIFIVFRLLYKRFLKRKAT